MGEEAKIQAAFMRKVKQLPCMAVKLHETNLRGMPDVMVLMGNEYTSESVVFIEFKVPGKEPTDQQLYRFGQLEDLGFYVYVFDNADDAYEEVAWRVAP